MADNGPENLTLRQLRLIDGKLDRLADDVGEVKRRMTLVDERVALIHADLAGISGRIDKAESRLERIERRLDLREDVS